MKSSSGTEVSAVSESAVQINWTYMKPAQFGFNVTLYKVLNKSKTIVNTKVMDGCAVSAQFNGLDGGTPYQIIINAIAQLNNVTETIESSIFFTIQKTPRVPPYGMNYVLLPGNTTVVQWTQPTLTDARGFVIGYTLLYMCYENGYFESDVYETNTTYLYLQRKNNSKVDCSVLMCSKTIAGCGPFSSAITIQMGNPAIEFQNNPVIASGTEDTYLMAIYILSSFLLLAVIIAIGLITALCTIRMKSSLTKDSEVQMIKLKF